MPTDLPHAFGQVLRRHRTRKKWSQMKLAMEAELHLNALGNLERGQRIPNLETVMMICRALEVPAAEVVAEVERMLRPSK